MNFSSVSKENIVFAPIISPLKKVKAKNILMWICSKLYICGVCYLTVDASNSSFILEFVDSGLSSLP